MAYFYPQYLEEQERMRKAASTQALTGRSPDPLALAMESYGTTLARGEKARAFQAQLRSDYLKSKGISIQEKAANQQTAGQAITGAGSLALAGYQLGDKTGLWKSLGLTKALPTTSTPTTSGAGLGEIGSEFLPTAAEFTGGLTEGALGTGAEAALTSQLAPEVAGTALSTGMATGAGEAAGLVGGSALGTAAGAEAAGATTALAATPELVTGATTVGTSILETLAPLLGFLGCLCYIFMEGNNGYLEDDVRRYRDEHYPKGGYVDYGYRWMASWLVPLMKRYSIIRTITKWIMLNPLAYYARWYYGHNKYGFIFWPAKIWVGMWAMVGRSIKPVVEGMFLQMVKGI